MPLASPYNCIGELVIGPGAGRIVKHESNLERRGILVFAYRLDVAELVEQPPFVRYRDFDGKMTLHWFDLLVTMVSGARVLVAFKPFALAQRKNFAERVEHIALQVPRTVADRAVLVTERDLNPIDVWNAELFHGCRHADPEADVAALAAIADLDGGASLADLSARTRMEGRGRRALVRLIAAGRLLPMVHERIRGTTLLTRAEVN